MWFKFRSETLRIFAVFVPALRGARHLAAIGAKRQTLKCTGMSLLLVLHGKLGIV